MALLKKGLSWNDIQQITLAQAVLILFGDHTEQERVQDLRIEAQIKWLDKIAKANGKTLIDFGRMGAEAVRDFVQARAAKSVKLEDLYPLLEEPEFSQ